MNAHPGVILVRTGSEANDDDARKINAGAFHPSTQRIRPEIRSLENRTRSRRNCTPLSL